MKRPGLVLMWLGIALFPAGVWWSRIEREAAGLPFDTRDWRVWLGFGACVVVYSIGALLRWRSRRSKNETRKA